MKPLTIDELKALQFGDWVWLVREHDASYAYIDDTSGEWLHYHHSDIDNYVLTINYSDYGTKWLAYKNKEFAESKGEWVELPCKIGDPIWVVYRDFDHGFNEYKIYKSTCVGFAFEHGTEIRIVTTFCCYDFDRVGNYTDESEAERRLAELKGEKL